MKAILVAVLTTMAMSQSFAGLHKNGGVDEEKPCPYRNTASLFTKTAFIPQSDTSYSPPSNNGKGMDGGTAPRMNPQPKKRK